MPSKMVLVPINRNVIVAIQSIKTIISVGMYSCFSQLLKAKRTKVELNNIRPKQFVKRFMLLVKISWFAPLLSAMGHNIFYIVVLILIEL